MYTIYLEYVGNHLSISSLLASHERLVLFWPAGYIPNRVNSSQCHLSINQRGNLELEKQAFMANLGH